MQEIPAKNYLILVEKFKDKYGRSPSILHIGNIANNAYNNAKLLNKLGFDCDVICYDYYHIMGCPEWEDADFQGEIKDQFFPNWNAVDLKNFQRPKWFAQGFLKFCIYYLVAKRQNRKISAWLWWQALEIGRLYICLINRLLSKYPFLAKIFNFLKGVKKTRLVISKFFHYIFIFFYCLKSYTITIVKQKTSFFDNFSKKINLIPSRNSLPKKTESSEFDERVKEIVELFQRNFPEREDQLSFDDLEPYRHIIPFWKKLFDNYDIIQGYSTDPILPLLAKHPYFAFEHGTLRDIPFEPTARGRLTSIAYSEAEHVFVTNSDCINNAIFLADNRVSAMNHPYDENHGLQVDGWQELRQELCKKLNADFLFFFPTRHDWVSGSGYADKGNDIFLNAFCHLRQAGYKVGLVCCQWGANVQDSIKLLSAKNCVDFVLWSQPMGTIQFERTAKACHVVVDQFKLGSFGGIVFKAMAVAAPICTYINENEILKHYSEIPPVINCKNEDELVVNLEAYIKNPAQLSDLASASKLWIDKHHSSWDTLKTQVEQYDKFLNQSKNLLNNI
ncbi:glycosyltransferase family 1 protein [Anabaena sp. 4-3]|uniref:glycosyltransferase family 1 protein n=1 Tax=Anabaena sp. 4-3 TaxID=1811979 RepID=UPI00082DD1B9|nr:glycosyltransferase family 1 protein [Anabaena sp. 4-3]